MKKIFIFLGLLPLFTMCSLSLSAKQNIGDSPQIFINESTSLLLKDALSVITFDQEKKDGEKIEKKDNEDFLGAPFFDSEDFFRLMLKTLFNLIVVLILNRSSNPMIRMGSIFGGILVGYIVALILGKVNFSYMS